MRAAIVWIERQQHAPRIDGACIVAQTLAVDRPELRQHLDLGRRVERHLGLPLEYPGQLLEVFGALVKPGERGQRFGVRCGRWSRTSCQRSMQISGFLTRSVASLAISRNLAAAAGARR